MATPAYATHAISAQQNNGPCEINKPTDLAEGDLMLAHLFARSLTGPVTGMVIDPPDGWAVLTETFATPGNGELGGVYAKVADAADAAASSFSFGVSGAVSWESRGAIVRITGDGFDVSLIQAHSSGDGIGDTTFEDTGLTPNIAGGLYLILLGMDAASGRSVSSYAFATDNPTWNEIYDSAEGSGADLAAAWGTRTSASATGNVTATASDTVDNEVTAVVFIPAITLVAAPALTVTASLHDPVVPTVVVDNPLSLTLTPTDPTVTTPGLPWSSPSKSPAPAWSNPDKTL